MVNLYVIFDRDCTGWLTRGGCQQYWGISSYSHVLDTVVVMELVHHPMYVVVISSPYKLIDFIHACTCMSRCSYMCTPHTHMYIYRIIYIHLRVVQGSYRHALHAACIVSCATQCSGVWVKRSAVVVPWFTATACVVLLLTTTVQRPLLLTVKC